MAQHTASPQPNEFDFLESDARRVHAYPLAVQRIAIDLPDGRSLSALKFGESAPEYVALHGAGLNAHSFDPMVFALGVPAITIDLPGHGHSSWRLDADYSPETIAPDITYALRQWAPAPVPLIGHSLGGLTALAIAASNAGLTSQLIVLDITPTVTMTHAAATVAEFITGQRSFGSIEEMVDRAIDFGIGTDREALRRGVTLNSQTRSDGRIEWIHHLAHLEGLPNHASVSEIPDVKHTLIRASSGMVNDDNLTTWRTQFPTSDVINIAGPHNLHEAVPAELAAVIAPLLRH
ncbi:MAG: alpha/beta fold hydrolase [Canibacter sp.]